MKNAKKYVHPAARRFIAKLKKQHPAVFTELNFETPFELLVATILSAQCTDKRVNVVTATLFALYPNPQALAVARSDELETHIRSTGFYRSKTRALIGMAASLVEHHGSVVPRQMKELVKLPGVGRKTANVVLGHALGVPGLPVDRHVLRVANRLNIATGTNPESVERQLCLAFPKSDWIKASDLLIRHGRRICKPRPLCFECSVASDCPSAENIPNSKPLKLNR